MPASRGKQADTAARRARVLQLRAAGMPARDIADRVGLPNAHAVVIDLQRGLNDARRELAKYAELYVTLELERLESYERATQTVLARASTKGDDWLALRAIDRLTRLSYRRGALLGFDAAEPGRDGTRGETPDDVLDDLSARRARNRARAIGG